MHSALMAICVSLLKIASRVWAWVVSMASARCRSPLLLAQVCSDSALVRPPKSRSPYGFPYSRLEKFEPRIYTGGARGTGGSLAYPW